MSDISQIAPSLERSMRNWLVNRRVTTSLRNLFPALVLIVIVLIAWELLVNVFQIEGFLLPKPSVIVQALQENFRTIIDAALFTLRAALGGFVMML